MTDTLERNRQSAMAFYDLMFNQCRPAEAIQRYAGGVYTQHNPQVGDGSTVQRAGRVHLRKDAEDVWVGGDVVNVIHGEINL